MYSKAFRTLMVQKMTSPDRPDVESLAAEVGVPRSTLYRWVSDIDKLTSRTASEAPLPLATMSVGSNLPTTNKGIVAKVKLNCHFLAIPQIWAFDLSVLIQEDHNPCILTQIFQGSGQNMQMGQNGGHGMGTAGHGLKKGLAKLR